MHHLPRQALRRYGVMPGAVCCLLCAWWERTTPAYPGDARPRPSRCHHEFFCILPRTPGAWAQGRNSRRAALVVHELRRRRDAHRPVRPPARAPPSREYSSAPVFFLLPHPTARLLAPFAALAFSFPSSGFASLLSGTTRAVLGPRWRRFMALGRDQEEKVAGPR